MMQVTDVVMSIVKRARKIVEVVVHWRAVK